LCEFDRANNNSRTWRITERYTVKNTVRRAQAGSSSEKHKTRMWRCAHLTVMCESMSVKNEGMV